MRFFFLTLFIPSLTHAATPTAPSSPAPAVVASAAPAPAPVRWKLSYFGEYIGPRLSNLSLAKTQGPLDPTAQYTGISHGMRAGYAVSSEVVLGTQVRGSQPFDSAQSFAWRNLRFYFSWKHMIDTSNVDMQAVVDWELPTSTGAKNGGLLAAFNIKNNWTFKTSLRNWSFAAMTLIRPMFYENPVGKTDIYFGIFPFVQYDLASDWALIVEGSFDASHSYNNMFFDFVEDDPDNLNLGVQYTVNSHVQINPALKFFTTDFTVPILYLGLSAAL